MILFPVNDNSKPVIPTDPAYNVGIDLTFVYMLTLFEN